jgi:hypothetical protein
MEKNMRQLAIMAAVAMSSWTPSYGARDAYRPSSGDSAKRKAKRKNRHKPLHMRSR